MKPKIKRVPGVSLTQLLTMGEIDFAATFGSEISDSSVEIVGPLPREISTPTALVGFISSHAKVPEADRVLLSYLSSSEAAEAYKACAMRPGH